MLCLSHKVRRWLQEKGIDHTIERIVWPQSRQHDTHTAIQQRARILRYALLARVCAQKGVHTILTAHHLDDNIETVFVRMGQHSGWEGLAGIAPSRVMRIFVPTSADSPLSNGGPDVPSNTQAAGVYSLRLCRPLLGLDKADLLRACQEARVDWLEDPSNTSLKYTRNAVRRALQEYFFPAFPCAKWTIAEGLRRIAVIRGVREAQVIAAVRQCVSVHPMLGIVAIPLAVLAPPPLTLPSALPPHCLKSYSIFRPSFLPLSFETSYPLKPLAASVKLKLLARVLQMVSGREYPLGSHQIDSLSALLDKIAQTQSQGIVFDKPVNTVVSGSYSGSDQEYCIRRWPAHTQVSRECSQKEGSRRATENTAMEQQIAMPPLPFKTRSKPDLRVTVAGCVVSVDKQSLHVFRQPPPHRHNRLQTLSRSQGGLWWDGRFLIRLCRKPVRKREGCEGTKDAVHKDSKESVDMESPHLLLTKSTPERLSRVDSSASMSSEAQPCTPEADLLVRFIDDSDIAMLAKQLKHRFIPPEILLTLPAVSCPHRHLAAIPHLSLILCPCAACSVELCSVVDLEAGEFTHLPRWAEPRDQYLLSE